MSTLRFRALETMLSRTAVKYSPPSAKVSDFFGTNVFNTEVQRQKLPKSVFKALQKTINQGKPLEASVADAVATAMKD